MARGRAVEVGTEQSRRMIARARETLEGRAIPERSVTVSAFDHETIGKGSGGSIGLGQDRVKLCPPEKPCRVCRVRLGI